MGSRIKKMKQTKILLLTKRQTFWHFSIIPLLLISPAFISLEIFKSYVLHTHYGRPIEEMLIPCYSWIIPALLFFFIQKRRLKFKEVHVSVDSVVFWEAIKKVAEELEWEISYKSTGLLLLHLV